MTVTLEPKGMRVDYGYYTPVIVVEISPVDSRHLTPQYLNSETWEPYIVLPLGENLPQG